MSAPLLALALAPRPGKGYAELKALKMGFVGCFTRRVNRTKASFFPGLVELDAPL
jgi:hypothetical protein